MMQGKEELVLVQSASHSIWEPSGGGIGKATESRDEIDTGMVRYNETEKAVQVPSGMVG
jgi:hypothetical protein